MTSATATEPGAEHGVGKGSARVTDTGADSFPVRQGEDPWSETEVQELRAGLEDEVARLTDEVTRAESDMTRWFGDSVDTAGDDPTDTGAKAYQREQDLALTYNTRELLAQTRRALERIRVGTYGACESCGNAIGKARLQAFPRATLCVRCKQREERR